MKKDRCLSFSARPSQVSLQSRYNPQYDSKVKHKASQTTGKDISGRHAASLSASIKIKDRTAKTLHSEPLKENQGKAEFRSLVRISPFGSHSSFLAPLGVKYF